MSTAGPEAADLAAACGLVLDEWQADLLDMSLSERADGTWAASDVKVIASRQNGKNGVVEARELFGAVILGEQIIHTAHLFATTRESFHRLLALVEACPDTAERVVAKYASPASGYEVRFRGGGRVKFIARSRTSGRGLTGNLLVFDEDQDLDDDAQGALLPTTSAVGDDRQVWYLGSAPGPVSTVAHRLRKRGRSGGDPRFAYVEFSADPESDFDDPQAWAQANPALGTRITIEAVEAERRSMSDEMFARERLSISPDILDGALRVFPAGAWEQVCKDVPQPDSGVVFAVDVNPERTSAALAVAAGRVCGLVDHRPGVGWVVDEAIRVARAHNASVAVAANGAAASLIADLERAGVDVVPLPTKDMVAACGEFYDSVIEDRVAVKKHAVLDAAVASAVKRTSGDAWVWDRRAGDVCALVAVTCAAYVAQNGGGPSMYESRGMRVLG